jgi:enterochelin esterase-like enzyme
MRRVRFPIRASYRALLAPLVLLSLPVSLASPAARASGHLGDNEIIASERLGYDLQYRVYLPAAAERGERLSTLYVTDGQWYIAQGDLPGVLDSLIGSGAIEPVIAVFIDNRDPGDPGVNRRNDQFFCNERYAAFVTDELVPRIESRHPAAPDRERRVILGVSFGALNAACFGLAAHETFGGIAMQSPALHPVPGIFGEYERTKRLPLRIFISAGTPNDNTAAARRLKRILEKRKYDLRYVEVEAGHDWSNWRPLLDDVLLFFFESPPA